MADLDVQVQLSLRDDLSRPAKKAMDAVRAASRTAEGGMGGVAKQAAKAGDAVEGMGRAARDAGEATAALARSNGPRSVKQQADGATRSLENMARSGQRAGQSLSQADAQAGRLRRTLDGVSSRMQAVTRQAARLGQGLGTGINGAMEAGAGLTAAGAVGRAALAAPMAREQQYLQDATVAFNERTEAGIKAGVAELRALDQQIVARGGGTLDSARAMRGAFLAGGMSFEDTQALAPLTQRAATAAGAEGADFANTLLSGTKSGQFTKDDAEKVFGMMLTAGASGSFETRDMAQYLPSIFSATGDMRGLRGTAQHLTGLEVVRDAAGNSAEAANQYQNLLSFRNSPEAYKNLQKKGINLAHIYRDAAKRGEDMNLAFVGAIQGLVERNKAYQRYKKQLAGASGEEAVRLRNEMSNIQDRIFGAIIGDQQAREGAKALQNGRGRYGEIYGDLTKDPEAMIDKLFSVMTSATQENFNRLGNEWEKGMDRVLDVVKGPLQDAIQWASGLMADNPELTALAGATATAGAMWGAGRGLAGGLRMLRGGQAGGQTAVTVPMGKPSAATSAGTPRASTAGTTTATGAGQKALAGNVLLNAALAAGQIYATETDDSLSRKAKNEANAASLGGLAGSVAGAEMGAAALAWAGPVGSAVGAAAGATLGGILGTELGQQWYQKAMVEAPLAAGKLPYDPDDPTDYLTALSARAEAMGRGPEQRPDAFDDYGAALFGGTTSFLDTGEGLEERLATLASRDDDRRAQEELKAALLEAARNMQTVQEQPLKVELHSTLELDGAVLAQSREDIMIREAARR
ncbi:phage tail tape measure protein [Desulfovibrio piger]|uniref:phage tail tape measure protein n=1 Tax=Desulfovibrio piger TaxID=901 RepID=UPI0026EF422A|nr:phage tail tape measure protein [Desulfovibrio piger]